MADDFLLDTDDLERRMEGAFASLRTEFASLRTGRASAALLDQAGYFFGISDGRACRHLDTGRDNIRLDCGEEGTLDNAGRYQRTDDDQQGKTA